MIDEIQRLPALFNEVHDLIESEGIRFILTGSSARKLKRGAANLLAGRARTHQLFPLLASEIGKGFDLERALRMGTLPWVQAQSPNLPEARSFLTSYANTCLREEIEGRALCETSVPSCAFSTLQLQMMAPS